MTIFARTGLFALASLAALPGCARMQLCCDQLAERQHLAVARLGCKLTHRDPACSECVGGEPIRAISVARSTDGACHGCAACPLGHCRLAERPEPGPPPVTMRPQMPPKFLPLPTQPILSPARPDAPEPTRGDVEVGYQPQLTFPGRD